MSYGRHSGLLAALLAAVASIPAQAPRHERERRDVLSNRITRLVRRQKSYEPKVPSRPIDDVLLGKAAAKRARRAAKRLAAA